MAYNDQVFDDVFVCQRFPPVFVKIPNSLSSVDSPEAFVSPHMLKNDWCGEWKCQLSNEQLPEQFVEQLPSAAELRGRLQRNRDENKLLKRLLKLACENEAVSRSKVES